MSAFVSEYASWFASGLLVFIRARTIYRKGQFIGKDNLLGKDDL
nr:hypothetical protein [Methanosarcina barkeri]